MTNEEKNEFLANQKEIERLLARQLELNPYASLKQLSNKEFGESWSESRIRAICHSFQKDNSRGHDFFHPILGRIEVKSARLPLKQITYNQCLPNECEYFLFVNYDTIEGTEEVFLVRSLDLLNKEEFSITKQHSRGDGDCYSVSGSLKKNKETLRKYFMGNLYELNNYLEKLYGENQKR